MWNKNNSIIYITLPGRRTKNRTLPGKESTEMLGYAGINLLMQFGKFCHLFAFCNHNLFSFSKHHCSWKFEVMSLSDLIIVFSATQENLT
jgi:hypothetical protein